ncbi:MAG: MBL fold metallo-hydrolase [Solobacterium sp.]|nr:MBL fold metallo-hydrolase [Solobacterium sp.]
MKYFANLRMIACILALIGGWLIYPYSVVAAGVLCIIAILCFPYALLPHAMVVKVLLIAAITGVTYYLESYPKHLGEDQAVITFLDVGQGDCSIIELPDGTVILIDGGTMDYGETVCAWLAEHHINQIDLMIGSHPHADHIGGLSEVVNRVKVSTYIEPETGTFEIPDTYSITLLKRRLSEHAIPVIRAVQGDVLAKGEDWSLTVLSPGKEALFDDLNDYSLILKLQYGSVSALFTGDAGYTAELEILEENLKSDILKVGHHGSFGSTCTAFLDSVRPSYAVISVGKDNEHHLPNSYILERLDTYGVNVYRTDESGTITMRTDGQHIEVSRLEDNLAN